MDLAAGRTTGLATPRIDVPKPTQGVALAGTPAKAIPHYTATEIDAMLDILGGVENFLSEIDKPNPDVYRLVAACNRSGVATCPAPTSSQSNSIADSLVEHASKIEQNKEYIDRQFSSNGALKSEIYDTVSDRNNTVYTYRDSVLAMANVLRQTAKIGDSDIKIDSFISGQRKDLVIAYTEYYVWLEESKRHVADKIKELRLSQ
jgi:hypothetical protein